MPAPLKAVALMSFVPLVVALGFVIPLGHHFVSGREVSISEWWSSGAGVVCMAAALVFAAGGVAILRRRAWGRVFCVAGMVIQGISTPVCVYLVTSEWPKINFDWLPLLVIAGIAAAYLFLSEPVRRYFASDS